MASLAQIFDLRNNQGEIKNKMLVALTIKATAVLKTVNVTQEKKDWALATLQNPESQVDQVMWFAFAGVQNLTPGQIVGVDDTVIQTVVNTYVDLVLG